MKIVPPKDWNPKLGISFDEFAFTTCEQQIDQLNHRCDDVAVPCWCDDVALPC